MDISGWFATSRLIGAWRGAEGRPGSVAQMIADDPFVITVTRETSGVTTTLAAQTVRIAQRGTTGTETFIRSGAGINTNQEVVVLGYKNHPTITDTNLLYGDRFAYNSKYYRVTLIERDFSDRLIALAEAID